MKLSIERSEIEKIYSQRNGYLMLAAGGILLCILQIVMIFTLIGREKIVLVPPSIEKRFWVAADNASVEYLSEMTSFFASLRLNMTPDNAAFQRESLLRYIDPAFYNTVKTELIKEEEKIKEQHISMAFYPVTIKVNDKKLNAVIEGDLKSFVGDVAMPSKRLSYRINYRFDHGRLLVKSFEEVKNA